ncbi:hypothetical protein [Tautonia plasticadhaerens]|uniref:hypothetical protein n=1 Tax=Tautonia plasticadhaerens TaxID=2527974 RepID=UPI00119CE203|nr:hypothetical protein [Tautonia plasticadhaerens]
MSSTYGPDEVTITDSAIRDLDIETGNHEDAVVLDGVDVSGLLSIDLGSNAETLLIGDSTIGTADVRTGSGNDTVGLTRVDFTGRSVSVFALGADSDSMTIGGGNVARGLAVDGGEDRGNGDDDSLRLYDSADVIDELLYLGLEYFRRFS